MTHKLYKKNANRGGVIGTVRPSAAPDGELRGFAILAAPVDVAGAAPLTAQGLDFMYWADVAVDGSFQIPKVRTGSYSLWLHLPGVLPTEQLVIDRLAVSAMNNLDVGEVVAENKRQGSEVLWQIGKADDSVAEFLNGQAAEEHGLFNWFDNGPLQGRELDFTVSVDDEATSWPYMQPMFNGSRAEWRVHFDRPPAGRLVFTVGIQSANMMGRVSGDKELRVWLNDQLLASSSSFSTHVVIRCGTTSGKASPTRLVAEVDADAAAALPSKNVLKLELTGTVTSPACGTHVAGAGVVCPSLAVLYDFIRLEHDPVASLI